MGRRRRTSDADSSGGDAAETAAIRSWERSTATWSPDRGRISAPIREAYHAAGDGQP